MFPTLGPVGAIGQNPTILVGGHSAEAIAFLARTSLTSPTDDTYINAYYTLIDGLVADDVWAYLHALYMLCTKNSTTALLDLISSTYNASVTGSITFTANQGVTGVAGSSSDYINTGFNPSASASQNDFHIGAWNNSNITDNGAIIGATDGSSQSVIYPQFAGSAYFRTNDAIGGLSGGVTTATSNGHYIGNRSAAGSQNGYINASSQSFTPVSSGSPANANVHLLHLSGAAASGYGGQISAAHIGRSLNSTKITALNSRIGAFRTAVGL